MVIQAIIQDLEQQIHLFLMFKNDQSPLIDDLDVMESPVLKVKPWIYSVAFISQFWLGTTEVQELSIVSDSSKRLNLCAYLCDNRIRNCQRR